MAMQFKTDTETLARRLTEGLEGGLEAAIKAELMQQAEAIVAKIAREMAHNLRAKIHMWHDHDNDSVQVMLVLDGARELLPPDAI